MKTLIKMKTPLCHLLLAVSLFVIVKSASAQVLFSDNFNGITGQSGYPATPATGANFELNVPGRIGGTLTLPAGTNYLNGFFTDGNEQLGNANTLPADNLDDNVVGDNLLLANQASDWINYDFSTNNSPISLTFNGLVDSGNSSDWLAVLVGSSAQSPWVLDTSFSILFRANGGTQYFNNGSGTTGGSGVAPGANVWQSYQIILSDSTGTGSAFAGNGSLITYYANGVKLGSAAIGQLVAGQGYLGFDSPGQIVGIDDIAVSVSLPVPWLPVEVQAISPANNTVGLGTNAVFTAAFSDSPPVNLQWLQIANGVTNDVNTGVANVTNSGVVTSTLTISNAQLAGSGSYYQLEAVNATNSAAVVYTPRATLTVVPTITWYAPGAGNGVFSGDSVLTFPGTVANEVYGVDFGGSGFETTTNGYTFNDYQASGNVSVAGSVSIFGGYEGAATTGDNNFDTILNNGISGSSANTATLNNLTVGQAYTVLVLLDDTRTSGAGGPDFSVTDGVTVSPTQAFAFPNGVPAVGGYIMGTFTARSTNQPLTVLEDGNSQYVAILLEKGTAPAPVVAPTIVQDVHPLVSKLSPGAPVTLSVVVAGSSPSYQWSNQNGPISGATNASYSFDAPAGPDSYNTNSYYCYVDNAAGNATSSTAEVISSTNIISVYNFSFEDGTTGSGSLVVPIDWMAYNDNNFSAIANNSYSVVDPLAPPADGDDFFAINEGPSDPTGGIYQDVGPLLPKTTYTLTVAIGLREDFTIGSGLGSPGIISLVNGSDDTGTVLATTNGLPSTSDTWQDYSVTFTTGPTVSGDLTVELSIAPASTYQANFDNVQLTKAPGPSIVAPSLASDISPLEAQLTTGTPVTFTVGANGFPLSYQWYNQNGPINGATTNTYAFDSLTGTNSYYVVVTNTEGAITSSIASVVSAPNIVTVNNYGFQSQILSPGQTVGGAAPTDWTQFNVGSSGSYYVGLTYASGSASDFTVPLTAPANGNNYLFVNRFNGNGTQVAGVYQDVGALQPYTTYTLTVAIGQRGDTGPNGSWSPGIISLVNGVDNTGTVLATGGGLPATPNTWQNYTITYTTGASVSGDLTVELSALDAASIQADFNNVELTKVTVTPTIPPVLNKPVFSGGNLILTGTGGTANAGYTWLTTTNLSAPIIWTTNSTGMLDGTGSFSNAIPVNPSQQDAFFWLRLP
jgi:hypothetical protein